MAGEEWAMTQETGPLPEGSVLVHLGPYKTGSTALQHSLAARREQLEAHGVWYPGDQYRHMRQSWAVTGRQMRGVLPVPMSEWEQFAASVRERTAERVCVSSEDFVQATEEQAKRIVEDLGGDRVHMVLVARRLDRILPSGWQERVKSANETRTYDDFLAATMAEQRSHESSRRFWSNADLESILGRWLPALPAERIHVLVADEEQRDRAARVFEQLLDLPAGLLAPVGRANASLSFERAMLVRRLNEIFDERGWSDRDRLTLIHQGMLRAVENVPFGSCETQIPPIPESTRARLAELDQRRIDALRVAGLHVIGDPELLRSDQGAEEVPSSSEALGIEVAARAVEGVVAARLRQARRQGRQQPSVESDPTAELTAVPARTLARELARRVRRRLRRGPRR
jgi:hypothetical protein